MVGDEMRICNGGDQELNSKFWKGLSHSDKQLVQRSSDSLVEWSGLNEISNFDLVRVRSRNEADVSWE